MKLTADKQLNFIKNTLMFIMKSKNQNNVVEFPGVENRELREQKKRLAQIIVGIETKMNYPYWDIVSFDDRELQALANFGETLKFTPLVASRLASNLANQILKKSLEEYEV